MKQLFVVVLLFAALAASVRSQSSPRSVRDGVYSTKQADRGAKLFETRCGSCHNASEFTGRFLDAWKGQAVEGLVEVMRTTMPVDDPGGLSRQDNTDLLAFILSRNGFPAGPEELESTPEVLKAVIFEAPKSPR